MGNRSVSLFSTIVLGGFIFVSIASVAFGADDAAKLKMLEQAVTAPAGENSVKKIRTRAIVFDNEPQAAAASSSPVAKESSMLATTETDCSAQPCDVAATAVDFAIQFKVGSSVISPASAKVLGQIAKIFALSPNRCILVEGHTDATGNPEKNMSLSHERANSVIRFIVEKAGMERNRFVPIGKGSSDPLNNVAPTDPINRRVVFKIVG